MRTRRTVSRLRSAVEGLRSSSRRVWWTSFAFVTLLTGLWVLADPPYAGPDEPAHVIKAVAVDRGQFTGEKLSPRLREQLRDQRQDFLMVRAPAIYGAASETTCFVYYRSITAKCLNFSGSTHDSDEATYVARHPPFYYSVVGAASWLYRPGSGAVYLMRMFGAS